MKDVLVTIGEAILMIVLVIIVWAVMSMFHMGHCVMAICRNTPRIVNKVVENKDRYLCMLMSVLRDFK